jgi:hypothetical protein
MPDLTGITRAEMERRLGEFDTARRALRWMLEHRVYYDLRVGQLLEPETLHGRRPLALPPDDILLFIHQLQVEIDLEAEQAG